MFGYVVVSEQDLKIREFNLYRSYYCGMCMDLKEHYGQTGRLTLSYDTVFLALLLTSLYEPEDTKRDIRCAVHPVEKHAARQNDYTRYAADINIILSYYSCLDDWDDEKDPKKRVFAAMLRNKSARACSLYPEKADVIRGKLSELHELEKRAGSDFFGESRRDSDGGNTRSYGSYGSDNRGNSAGSYDTGRSSAPAPSTFSEMEGDDGDLPF